MIYPLAFWSVIALFFTGIEIYWRWFADPSPRRGKPRGGAVASQPDSLRREALSDPMRHRLATPSSRGDASAPPNRADALPAGVAGQPSLPMEIHRCSE